MNRVGLQNSSGTPIKKVLDRHLILSGDGLNDFFTQIFINNYSFSQMRILNIISIPTEFYFENGSSKSWRIKSYFFYPSLWLQYLFSQKLALKFLFLKIFGGIKKISLPTKRESEPKPTRSLTELTLIEFKQKFFSK